MGRYNSKTYHFQCGFQNNALPYTHHLRRGDDLHVSNSSNSHFLISLAAGFCAFSIHLAILEHILTSFRKRKTSQIF